jgi:rod shape-determining protein MreC
MLFGIGEKEKFMIPLWRNRPLMITIIMVIVLLVVLIMTSGDNNMTGTESIVGTILAPVQQGLYSATDAIADFFARVFSGSDLQTENFELKSKVAELTGQLQDLDETKKENERLRELLNYEAEPGIEFVTARVIGRDPNHWYDTFIINLGISDGIEIDMPVVNGDGLIGRIVEVGAKWSKVMPIVDSSSGVSGFVVRTRDNGILNGTPTAGVESALLKMSKLVFEADLTPGDIVITSGQGGVFPKGIPIGEVTEVSQSDDGMRNQAIVTPFVDFVHIEEVMIITTVPIDVEELLE